MKIETNSLLGTLLTPGHNNDSNKEESSLSFAALLKEKVANTGATANTGDNQSENSCESDLATIREKGFLSYFKELQAEKLEELREKILNSMGITEEDLSKMPPEQRSAIENIISEEIKKRLAAGAIMENGEDKAKVSHWISGF